MKKIIWIQILIPTEISSDNHLLSAVIKSTNIEFIKSLSQPSEQTFPSLAHLFKSNLWQCLSLIFLLRVPLVSIFKLILPRFTQLRPLIFLLTNQEFKTTRLFLHLKTKLKPLTPMEDYHLYRSGP